MTRATSPADAAPVTPGALSATAWDCSVIIPAYNYARFLPRAIESVLQQTLPPTQIIVVDDGSTDETPAVLDRYRDQVTGLRQANAGVSAARNRGLDAASGQYIVFLDADDALLPTALATFADLARRHPDAGLLAGRYYSVDTSGARRASAGHRAFRSVPAAFAAFIQRDLTISNGTAAWKRQLFEGVRYPVGVTHGEDVAVTGLAVARAPVVFSDEFVAEIFAHGSRARDNAPRMLAGGLAPVSALFDHPLLPERFRSLRPRFAARWQLSLARAAFRSGRFAEAKALYGAAFAQHWPLACDPTHAWRFAKSSLLARPRKAA